MNNDIARDLNKYLNAMPIQNTINNKTSDVSKIKEKNISTKNPNSLTESMEILGFLGSIQVKRDSAKTLNQSVEEFIQDPDGVKEKVDFCDELIGRGLCLEEADNKTRQVFSVLQNPKSQKRQSNGFFKKILKIK